MTAADVSRGTSQNGEGDEGGEAPRADLFVCDWIDDGKVCGADFDSKSKLNAHTMGKHKRTESMGKGGGRKPSGKADAKPSRPTSRPAPFDRPTVYTQGIATLALGAHLTLPKFDAIDLDIVNKGAGSLASALDATGQRHAVVREACDLILGAGPGGPYLQLLLAALAIAAPILAHHGMLPPSTGERFGAVIGAVNIPQVDDAPDDNAGDVQPPRDAPDTEGWTAEDYENALLGMPPTVGAELAGRMMSGGVGPTVVRAPGETVADVRPEPGPEQLAPDAPAVA